MILDYLHQKLRAHQFELYLLKRLLSRGKYLLSVGDFYPVTQRGMVVTIFFLPVGLVLGGAVISRSSRIREEQRRMRSANIVLDIHKEVLRKVSQSAHVNCIVVLHKFYTVLLTGQYL